MKGVGVFVMLFGEVLLVVVEGDVQPLAGNNAPFVQGILIRVAQTDEFIIALKIREAERGNPAASFHGGVARPFQVFGEASELWLGGRFVKTADADIDGMDFAATNDGHDLVADFLQAQPALHGVRMILGHLDDVFIAKKIRGMKHVDVQRMAFNPLAAIEQPAQLANGAFDVDAESLLSGVTGAHLIGNGADAANARGDIGSFAEFAAPEKSFKEARRFEDVELHFHDALIAHPDEQAALTLDACKDIDLDGLSVHALRSLSGKLRRKH